MLLVSALLALTVVAFIAGTSQVRGAGAGAGAPHASGSITAPASALTVFDRPVDRTDVDIENARAVLGDAVEPSSLRQLTFRVGPGATFFAARDLDGRVCLVAVINQETFATSCTTDAAFARESLRIAFVLPSTRIRDTDTAEVVRDVSAEWTPDGISRGLVTTR